MLQWHSAGEPLPTGRFDLAFSLGVSDYRGERQAQMVWIDARQGDAPAPQLDAGIDMVDYRRVTNAACVLRGILHRDAAVQVWAEGADRPTGSRDRMGLQPADELVIWTIPPGATELQAILTLVRPARVYLFAHDPGLDHPQPFGRRLLGLVKTVLSERDGAARLTDLSAAMSHRDVTVRVGLQWLAAKGAIELRRIDGEYRLAQGSGRPTGGVAGVEGLLVALLEETRAFRRHFRSAEADSVIRVTLR